MRKLIQSLRTTTKKNPDLKYKQPQPGQPFWIPTAAENVAAKFRWSILYVEQHPDGSIIITFGSGTGSDKAGHIWEMSLDVVSRMDKTTPSPPRITEGFPDWF